MVPGHFGESRWVVTTKLEKTKKHEKAIELIDSWLEDKTEHDKKVWARLAESLGRFSLSYRKRVDK